MRVLLGGGEDGRGMVGECLLQGRIRGGGDDGIEIGPRGDLRKIGPSSVQIGLQRGE